jgi:hypothetical protein
MNDRWISRATVMDQSVRGWPLAVTPILPQSGQTTLELCETRLPEIQVNCADERLEITPTCWGVRISGGAHL